MADRSTDASIGTASGTSVPAIGPLAGIRVVELAALGAVPHAAMMLSDAGADVLRIDRPETSDAAFDLIERGRQGNAVTRGRRSVAVDLKQPDAASFVLELVRRSHVFLEGFRPGVAERLGVGPDACLAVQPSLVYGRLTGWGRDGPLAGFGGHDINYVALSGTLAAMGPADRPPPVPLNVVADFGGGSMQLAFGVVAALVEATRTGRGQVVDAAMVDGAASLATYIHSMRGAGTWVDQRESNVLDGGAPFYGVYETSDHRFIAVGAIEPQFYQALIEGLGFACDDLGPQLDRDSWPTTRQLFRGRIATRTRDEWVGVFAGIDACVTPVLTMHEATEDEHLRDRGSFLSVGGVVQPAPVPRFGSSPHPTPAAPVSSGVGGRAALAEWGVDEMFVEAMIDQGVVTLADDRQGR
ncbi:MAG: CaiB/BaiF CoA-transferase family protein [Ilumatobacteraceae bacterium]